MGFSSRADIILLPRLRKALNVSSHKMKRSVTIFSILTLIYINTFFDYSFKMIVTSLLLFALLSYLMFLVYRNVNMIPNSEVKVKQTRRGFNLFLMLPLLITLPSLIERPSPNYLILTLIILMLLAIDITLVFLYAAIKPYTLYADENKLFFNDFNSKSRNLSNLTEIRYSHSSDKITLKFSGESDLILPFRNFEEKSLGKLLAYAISKSQNNVSVSESLRSLLYGC
jgi:hypothetical protein